MQACCDGRLKGPPIRRRDTAVDVLCRLKVTILHVYWFNAKVE